MNEAETRAEHIDPALKTAGWGVVEGSRVLREHGITLGRLQGGGGKGVRARAEIADYVLVYRNTKLAVIEAKAWDKPLTEGVGQAKRYAAKLALRSAFATNGQAIYGIDMTTGVQGDVASYPGPTRCGHSPSLRPTRLARPGVSASPSSLSRTRAAPGRDATTRTSRSRACWK